MAAISKNDASANRMSRKRQMTHGRLIDAALLVMASKGVESATIADITEAADVGFGSFYNHFSSKEDVVIAVIEALTERIADTIDDAIASIDDPLDLLAVALRLCVSLLLAKPEWAQFVVRIAALPGYRNIGLFARLTRDLHAAQQAGRLQLADVEMAGHALAGAMLFMVTALIEGELPQQNAPERITSAALRILGLSETEIAATLEIPLPDLVGGLEISCKTAT